jgi:hypothetical protein
VFDFIYTLVATLVLLFLGDHYANFLQSPTWGRISLYVAGAAAFVLIWLLFHVGMLERRFNALVRLLEMQEMENNEKARPQGK